MDRTPYNYLLPRFQGNCPPKDRQQKNRRSPSGEEAASMGRFKMRKARNQGCNIQLAEDCLLGQQEECCVTRGECESKSQAALIWTRVSGRSPGISRRADRVKCRRPWR